MIIKLMSFNIQHALNYVTRKIDIDLMVSTIKQCNAEVIGLQEVFGADTDNLNQAEEIAKKLGYYFYFAKAIDYKGRPYGNAVISKFPFLNCETIMIEDPVRNTDEYYETRCIIKAQFAHFTLLNIHIGLAKSEKINAVSKLLEIIPNIKTPLILLGDFNMEPDDIKMEPIIGLLKNTIKENKFSFPSINPNKKIDYIFVSEELDIIDADIANIVASDHLPHIATISIK